MMRDRFSPGEFGAEGYENDLIIYESASGYVEFVKFAYQINCLAWFLGTMGDSVKSKLRAVQDSFDGYRRSIVGEEFWAERMLVKEEALSSIKELFPGYLNGYALVAAFSILESLVNDLMKVNKIRPANARQLPYLDRCFRAMNEVHSVGPLLQGPVADELRALRDLRNRLVHSFSESFVGHKISIDCETPQKGLTTICKVAATLEEAFGERESVGA